ncbi:TerD family protein [Enterobacter cloacae complex sp. P15RS]|uniref:TerD family protein n=1 Tax=Enterobacter cloacae complex sp. P15RS TaxID=2779578 RepID=UPI00186940EA|nr:TerD family protein [Enterobacter cloacae complex sp. P15RS]MBE3470449.1 TerD family protein [Enterobacter cloacae complex sp. P15RS]
MNLTPGGNAPVPSQELRVRITSGGQVDASAFRLYADGKVQGDADMVFYGQTRNEDGTVSLISDGHYSTFAVALNRLKPDVQKMAFTVTCDGGQTISGLRNLSIDVEQGATGLVSGTVELSGRQEAALILGEFYRRNQDWKFRFVAQGFNGGLKPLAEHFGVNIADEQSPAAPTPPVVTPPPAERKICLSKVSLTKEKPAISLTKRDNFGEIRINLNWHRGSSKSGFAGMFGSRSIDLDLGAFVALQNGYKSVIQALGNAFGDFRDEPYVQLKGDDRTGDMSDGEWLHINGREWKHIREVLIYAFIYEGVPGWDKTDGVVTIHVPDQPPIETRLTEGENRRTLCAIARLVNENGAIKVERINQYFKGQNEMDRAFGWGFRWRAGSK